MLPQRGEFEKKHKIRNLTNNYKNMANAKHFSDIRNTIFLEREKCDC
jgi:hypothetical protein